VTEERLLTVPEVAVRLRVSEWTVRRWLRDGRISGQRIGGTRAGWRIRSTEVERFIGEGPRSPRLA